MARSGVTREQVFETADALVREGASPTVVSVRTRMGGGSPNTITPLLAEWRALQDTARAQSLPAIPEPVEAVMRQVWGVAWQEAQGQLSGERQALEGARKALEQERGEMLAEIARLDTDLETARSALEAETQAHTAARQELGHAQAAAREAQAIAAERDRHIAALTAELERVRQERTQDHKALTALRVEVATLSERAAQMEELKAALQAMRGSGEGRGGNEVRD